jgi:hypothetical protein
MIDQTPDDFISLRSDGVFVWTSPTGKEWEAFELFQAALKQNLSPADEAVIFDVVDTLRRLQRQRPKLHPFV